MTDPPPDPGSFRDPMSRVYVDGATVWRGLSAEALADYEAVAATRFFPAAIARGDIVATELVGPAPTELVAPAAPAGLATPAAPTGLAGWAGVLRHERIDVLSYPYEWTFGMLRDAARLQLDLTRQAVAEQMITKDASSYNVQFVGTRPVFLDVGSFERLRGSEPWPGYRQFCELFLNPLLVQAVRNVPFQPLLRGRVDGISPAMAADLLRGSGRLTKGVFTHVKLHARAEQRYADRDPDHDVRAELKRAGFGPRLTSAQLANLGKAVDALTWDDGQGRRSAWADYGARAHYGEPARRAKDEFVRASVAALVGPGRGRVLDLGANDGHFSRLALAAGATSVVAVDSDAVVVDRLYRDLVAAGERRILPLVVDIADPSPALGWRSRERPAFVERVRADVVLCLAVVHHLALTDTVPLEEIVAFLADLGAPVVVEFPHRDDPMAARLLARKRPGVFDGYDVTCWEHALAARFAVREREVLPGGTRTLYRAVPR